MELPVLGIHLPAWLILAVLCVVLLYLYATWTYGTWSQQGIPGPKPWPLVGNTPLLSKMGFVEYQEFLHKTYGRIAGSYSGRLPVLYVTDIAMLKQVMVKDFSSFINRSNVMNDYPLDQSLPTLEGDVWKRVRSQMTPAFSSGKLRQMTVPINDCADIMVNNLKKKADGDVNMRDLTNGFTMDVICRVAFGIQVDSQKDSQNLFVQNGRKFAQANMAMVMIAIGIPPLYKLLQKLFNATLFSKQMLNFFCQVTEKLIEERHGGEQQDRVDMLHLMMKAIEIEPNQEDIEEDNEIGFKYQSSAKGKKGMSKHEMMGNTMIFFLAGSETTSSLLTYFSYCLALNPAVHQRLTAEIDKHASKEEIITPAILTKMTYLDMCIQETLRIYPPSVRVERMCSKATRVGDCLVPSGSMIAIPIRVIHLDPEYWPEPLTFNPDRFSAEEKAVRDPLTWLPFGFGPRNCIGMRLALMELKIAAIKLLQNFQFQSCSQTKVPLTFTKNSLLQSDSPIILKVVQR